MLTRYSLVPLVALFFMPAIGGRALVPVRTGGMSHLITSLHLRGGKSLGGQGTNLGAGGPESQGVQLPLLRNVLDMATSLSTASNSSNASALPSLDPDRMAFLQNAFAEMLENTTDVFTTSITRLSLPEDCEANISLKERALFAIAERTENMDLAEGLLNLGGLAPAIDCLASNHSIIRQRAAEVVAAAVQNLETLKVAAHGFGALDKLIKVYANREEVHETRSKSLHAISALIQGNSSAELSFLFNQGLGMLRCDIQIGDVRIRRKALFVLSQLLRSNAVLRAAVGQMQEGDKSIADKGVLPELVQVMTVAPEGTPDPQMVEFAISAIVSVLEPDALNNAHTPETVAPETKMPEPTAMGRRLGDMLPHLGEVLHKRIDSLLAAGVAEEEDDLRTARRLLALIGA